MKIETIPVQKNKKEAIIYVGKNVPLMSRVCQFNSIINDLHLEYIEIKVLNYEIISKEKSSSIFRTSTNKDNITMLVNTYNGYSQSIDYEPKTMIKYVTKTNIKKSNIKDTEIIEGVKREILKFLTQNSKVKYNCSSLKDINITYSKSIYKPYWVGAFKGRTILIDA